MLTPETSLFLLLKSKDKYTNCVSITKLNNNLRNMLTPETSLFCR